MKIECPYCHIQKELFQDCPKCGKISMGEGAQRLAHELGRDITLEELGEDIFKREKIKEAEKLR